MTIPSRVLIGSLATVAALGLSAAPAFATGPSTSSPTSSSPTTAVPGDAKAPASLPAIQAKAATAVEVREAALAIALTRVQNAGWLGADQAALLSTLQGDEPKLQALGQKIANDTDVATARADYEDIFSQYRVFALVLPVTRIVTESDRITAQAGPRLTAAAQKLQARQTTADSAQVAPLLDDLASKVQAATGAVDGLAARVLTLTPAAYDADTSVLKAPETAVKTAAGDIKAALADARQARALERGARAGRTAHQQGGAATASAAFSPTV